jgi:DNA repair exonuclease SbcCD ATPase subunit
MNNTIIENPIIDKRRKHWVNFLLTLAWILVVVEVLISSMIGWSHGYQTYLYFEINFESFNYFDIMLASLPFLIVGAVCLSVIPLCYRIYTRDIKFKIIFSVILLAVTLITFETLITGFERNYINSSKSIAISEAKLELVLEEIQFKEKLFENVEKEFADTENEEEQNLDNTIKENNAAIEVYRKNIRDRKDWIEAHRADSSLIFYIRSNKIGQWEKEIKWLNNEISRLIKINSSCCVQIGSDGKKVEMEKNILRGLKSQESKLIHEIISAYENLPIYELAKTWYNLEDGEIVTKKQMSTIARFWFGSIAGFILLIPIFLAFGAFRLKYGTSGKPKK